MRCRLSSRLTAAHCSDQVSATASAALACPSSLASMRVYDSPPCRCRVSPVKPPTTPRTMPSEPSNPVSTLIRYRSRKRKASYHPLPSISFDHVPCLVPDALRHRQSASACPPRQASDEPRPDRSWRETSKAPCTPSFNHLHLIST